MEMWYLRLPDMISYGVTDSNGNIVDNCITTSDQDNDLHITFSAPGEYTLTATLAANDLFNSATTSMKISVVKEKADPDLHFPQPTAETTLDSHASASLQVSKAQSAIEGFPMHKVTYGVTGPEGIDTSRCISETDGDNMTLSFSAPGVYTLTANYIGDNDYLPSSASMAITVHEYVAPPRDPRLHFPQSSAEVAMNAELNATITVSGAISDETDFPLDQITDRKSVV